MYVSALRRLRVLDACAMQYVIVIQYPRGLYGIYCLSPIVTHALPSDSLTSLIIAMVTMSAPWLPFDVIATYKAVYVLASLASARRECSE